ncbi:MAG: tRNA pseudouridine synthase A [Saprospiraceae bacterium]|nr:tRNA pseudouridine synthase A [Saprospiraceae bacterium]
MRFFFHISFKGTHYSGWQRQTKGIASIQEELENALHKVTGSETPVMGCGRTDAGVHASSFFAHFDASTCPDIIKLNYTLPADIVIHQVFQVQQDAHARYDALSRTYDYFIHASKNAFQDELSFLYGGKIIFPERVHEACDYILKNQDFKSFCKTPERHKSTVCTIYECYWEFDFDEGRHHFRIKANRFLKSMVRILVHDLLAVGEGRISLETFRQCLEGNRDSQIHQIAYPQGLYLSEIEYTYLKVEQPKIKLY